jgi:hypothetical protein
MAVRTVKNGTIKVDGYVYTLEPHSREPRHRGELNGHAFYFKIHMPADKRRSRFAWLICTAEAYYSDERFPADIGPHHNIDTPGKVQWRSWRGRKTK